MHNFASIAALCLLSFSVLPASAMFCWVNVNRDFSNNQPLILQENANEFLYPRRAGSKDLRVGFCENIRAACPQSKLKVFWSTLQVSEAALKCYGLTFFDVVGTRRAAPFRRISCTQPPVAEASRTGETCLGGNATKARIGFELDNGGYAATIDEICHDEALGQTHWAHSKVSMSVRNAQKQSTVTPAYETADFYEGMGMSSTVYTRKYQRDRFATLFNDSATVDRYLPTISDKYLVEGMLAPRDDMFYKSQQNSTFFYINTVPMWKSIRDKNWKLVEDIVRKTAAKYSANLDVWTGGIDTLSLDGVNATATDITLLSDTNGNSTLPVPKHLFKYVVDRAHSRGVVYVTLNNPYVTTVSDNDTICQADTRCTNMYPQFNIAAQGYTYCCTVDSSSEFFAVAESLELPTFAKARILI